MEFNATFLISAISFILFIIIMNKILYEPILGIMQKREEYINSNKNEAALHEKNAQGLIEDKNSKIGDAHRKSRDIVAVKTEAIKDEKNRALNTAKSETGAFVDAQKEDLSNQKNEIYYRLKGNTADLANNITSKLVGEGVEYEPLSDSEVDEVIRKNA